MKALLGRVQTWVAHREGWPCLGPAWVTASVGLEGLLRYELLPSVVCAGAGEGASRLTALLTLQTKYDANQQARKHLLPVTTGDLSSKEHHRSPLEKPHNGILFPQHGDYQYGRNNVLTDHFQYSRQSYPNYSLNRYDV